MRAQGALGNPFIFQQIAAALRGESIPVLTVSRRMEDMLRQCRLICENRGERRGILDMRKHAGWYIRGVDGAAEYRRRAVAASDYAAFEAIASEILSNCKGN